MKDEPKKPNIVATLQEADDPEGARATANLALQPNVSAAAVISQYSATFGGLDIKSVSDSLSETINQVWNGDVKTCEAMLFAQAQALQTIFMSLSCRAANQDFIGHRETYLKLALKAQNQCRTTLETLSTIKNPPVIFAKQANIAHGHQQVNNGIAADNMNDDSHTRKNKFDSNELLEQKNEQRLDTRATDKTSVLDPKLETMAEIHRAEKQERQSAILP